MNDLQKELQELKAKVADLESRSVAEPVAKWQPKGGDWWINSMGKVLQIALDSRHMKFGTERATKEQAERASVEMRRFNRLLALRDELCGDDVVDWTNYEEKYYVYFSHESGAWYVSSDEFCESIQPYFTSENVAQKACNMLNSGEVEL
jgi:hypothetical protein